MAQSVERRLGKAEVTGSIPVISFKKSSIYAGLLNRVFEKVSTRVSDICSNKENAQERRNLQKCYLR